MNPDPRERPAVARPLRTSEFQVLCQGKQVLDDWNELVSSSRNAMIEAWEALANHPVQESPRQYQLRGDEAARMLDGVPWPQWQYKVTDGARILYLVDTQPVVNRSGKQLHAGRVVIIEVSAGHPKRTEKVRGRR